MTKRNLSWLQRRGLFQQSADEEALREDGLRHREEAGGGGLRAEDEVQEGVNLREWIWVCDL